MKDALNVSEGRAGTSLERELRLILIEFVKSCRTREHRVKIAVALARS